MWCLSSGYPIGDTIRFFQRRFLGWGKSVASSEVTTAFKPCLLLAELLFGVAGMSGMLRLKMSLHSCCLHVIIAECLSTKGALRFHFSVAGGDCNESKLNVLVVIFTLLGGMAVSVFQSLVKSKREIITNRAIQALIKWRSVCIQ